MTTGGRDGKTSHILFNWLIFKYYFIFKEFKCYFQNRISDQRVLSSGRNLSASSDLYWSVFGWSTFSSVWWLPSFDKKHSEYELTNKCLTQASQWELSSWCSDVNRNVLLFLKVMYLWIGRNCNPSFLTQVLGVPSYAAVPENLVGRKMIRVKTSNLNGTVK